jgi:hypothetical protein
MLGFINIFPLSPESSSPLSYMSAQHLSHDSFAPCRPENKRQLLSISPPPVAPGPAVAIKQVDFDPQPSPSTYRVHPGRDYGFPADTRSSSTDCRLKDCSPSTGSSSSFFLSDPDVLRCSIGSASDLRDSRSRHFGSLVYHWTEHRGDMSPHSHTTGDDRRYADDNLWSATNAKSNEEIRYALVEALEGLQAIKGMCHEDSFETQQQW